MYLGVRGSAFGWGTIQKVAGLIPDGVFEIFYWLKPSGRIMAL